MATTKTSDSITSHGYTLKSYITYEVTTNNATTYTLSIKAGIWIGTSNLSMSSSTATSTLSQTVSGTTTKITDKTMSVKNPGTGAYYQEYINTTRTYTKGTSAASKTISNKITFSSSSYFSGMSATVSFSFTVPAKPTYTISYNANGGSGAPGNQTKTYGVTLTLSTTKPTRTGYTFKGWATSSTSTTVAYAAGASYTGNANLSLYAVWQINTWTVTYNANGGSGSIANQTKTYNQALTLSNGAGFTRSLYNLVGWATSAGGAKAYDLSGSYTGNAALNLYAVWELAYVKPVISNFQVYRVDENNDPADDGERVLITFAYTGGSVDGGTTLITPTCMVTFSGSDTHTLISGSMTPMSGSDTLTAVYDNFSKDNSYAISVKLYDSTYTTGVTKSATIPTAIYLIDAIGSGTNVYAGIMHKAVSGKELTLPSTNLDGVITSTRTDGISFLQTSDTIGHDVGFRATVDDSVNDIHSNLFFGIGGSGVNRGIYDTTAGAWTIFRDSTSNVNIPSPLSVTGNISASGSATATGFTVSGHASAIGTFGRSSGTAITISSSSNWQSAESSNSISLGAGTWLIIITGIFSANGTTGTRAIRPNAGGTAYAYGQSQITPSNNNQHTLTCIFVDATTASSKKYYAEVFQNGGSNETVTVHIQHVRIA